MYSGGFRKLVLFFYRVGKFYNPYWCMEYHSTNISLSLNFQPG